MFDAQRLNGFVNDELDNRLFSDIWNFCVFNESDLHSAAYFYIREYFFKRDSKSASEVIVRCEPVMEDRGRPDIVIYNKYDPIYMIELKMFKKTNLIHEHNDTDVIKSDLDALKAYIAHYPTIRWGFQISVYDSEEIWKPSSYALKKAGYEKISVRTINLRRQEDNKRRRNNYDQWRKQFDKYLERHF